MAEMTVNKLLVLEKAIRERLNELRTLRNEVSKKEHWMTDREKVVEPLYDVKKVDKKITELEQFLFNADAEIKGSNAVTKVTIEADISLLLAPLE